MKWTNQGDRLVVHPRAVFIQFSFYISGARSSCIQCKKYIGGGESTEEWGLQVCLKETLLAFFFLLEKMLEINVWPHQMSLKFQKVICLLSVTYHPFFSFMCLRHKAQDKHISPCSLCSLVFKPLAYFTGVPFYINSRILSIKYLYWWSVVSISYLSVLIKTLFQLYLQNVVNTRTIVKYKLALYFQIIKRMRE